MRGAIKAARLCMLRHPVAISFGAASIVYSLLSLFYMGGAITDCSESLLTFPGDNTAGLIALFTVDSHDPWFGYTYYFSYPYGELIGQPTHITAQVLFVPFWILAKLLGPVCGFNLLTLMGFLSASLTMFAFIRWLFRGKFLVALLAGFAVAFTPYLQVKTGVHISYIFEALFIATIWLFLSFWREPTVKRAVCLGVSIAACAYTDGYFILLEGVLVAGLLLGALVYDYVIRREALGTLKQRVKPVCLAFGTAVVLMLPVLYTVYNSAGQINQSLVTTRDSIFNEAQVYGARPLEYLLPNALNPVLNPIFGDYESRNNHGSNPAENLLSLSLVLLGLSLFLVITLYRWRSDKSLARVARYDIRFIAVVIAAVFIVAGLTSLPPKVGPLVTPSYFLIQLVELWRVFARLGVIVNIALVILASGGLILLLDRIKSKRHRMALVLAVFVVVFVEYLTFTPPVRPVVGYERVPELYHWLSKQQAYREIAEYPLDEFAGSGNPVFYNTYQRMHGKKLLNGIISNDDAIFARQALRDLLRPQTVPGLRTLGIDFITIHSPTDPGPIPGLTLRHVSDEKILETNGKPNKVWGYSVDPGPKATYAVAAVAGFHAPISINPFRQTQVVGHEGVLRVRPLVKPAEHAAVEVSLRAKALAEHGQQVQIIQQGKVLWEGILPASETQISFKASVKGDIHIRAIDPKADATLHLTQLSL